MNDRVGQQIGNYRLVRLLGSGGFADVYLGRQIFLDSPAAIKLLHTNLAQEDIEGFRSEARTLVRLIHPHIIRILDFGLEGNTPFLVMDYAPHGTIRQRYARGRQLPLAEVVEYVKQAASGLQQAHNEKIIHRDIKPENLLLGRQNEILLSDFGIAVVAQSTLTQLTQEMSGTIAYMAPEQMQAHARPASDQYSLGVVAYEWLSGSPPFTGSFNELAFKQLTATPPPLREKVPELPTEVEQVILTALAKEPTRRFSTIQAFATALEQASQEAKTFFSTPAEFSHSAVAPVTPILPLLNPAPEQDAYFSQGPTRLNTSPASRPVSGVREQAAPPTLPAQPNPHYNPVTPVLAPPVDQPPATEQKGISRRTVVVTSVSTAGILVAGGIAWQVFAHAFSSTTGTANAPTPVPSRTGTATTAKTTSTVSSTHPPVPQLLAQDTFQRADQPLWGTASDGRKWSGDAATSSDFSILHQQGQVHRTATGHSLYTATLGTANPDVEILVTAMLDSFNGSHIGVMLRYSNDNHYYKVLLDGGSLHFLKRIDPQHGPAIGQSIAYSPQAQTLYTLRLRMTGSLLQAKVWQANTTEPAGWMISATDSDPAFATGMGGLRPQLNQGVTLTVTSFQMSLATI
jgi:serine/threonine protein kinase